MDLTEVGRGKDWTDLAQYTERLGATVNAKMNLGVP
jgi:hypothetical protein